MAENNNDLTGVFILGIIIFLGLIISSNNAIFVSDGVNRAEDGTALRYDTYTNNLVIMEFEHERIHQGKGYQASGVLDNIAAAAEIVMLMNTSDEVIHWREFIIACDASPILLEFIESPNVTSYGTEVDSYNRNRLSSNNSTATVYINGTLGTGGTILFTDKVLGTKQDAGSTSPVSLEWNLPVNSTYAMRFTNQNGNGVNCAFRAFWYED